MKIHFFKDSNIPAFILSCFFVIYGFVNISPIVWVKVVMFALGLYVEYEAYKIWGLSFAYKEDGRPYKWMRGVYIAYILIFALPSAIGFFAVDVMEQDNTNQVIQDNQKVYRDRINQLPGLIEAARLDMSYEREHGGTLGKYRAAKSEYDRLNAEYADLTNPKKKAQPVAEKPPKPDMFTAVSKVLWGFPKYALILLMCTAALAMVYIGMMLQPPKYTLPDSKPDPETLPNVPEPALIIRRFHVKKPKKKYETILKPDIIPVSPIIVPKIPVYETPKLVPKIETIPEPKIETIETIGETIQKTVQKVEKICLVCGEKFMAKPSKKKYCCSKCRLKDFRKKNAEEG
jgi:ribosomal protein S27AE